MDSSKSLEDDTIRDQMESGYVATRPRFTRARRTWKVNVRNLQAEDVRAVDQFAMSVAARGGNAFLFPNVLPNGSFEFPALSATDVAFGWNVSAGAPQESVGITTTTVEDGTHALGMATVAGQSIPANSTITGQVSADQRIPCNAGEVYIFRASVNAIEGALAAGVLMAGISLAYFDANGNALSVVPGPAAQLNSGWETYWYSFTVPAGAATFTVQLGMSLTNSTGAAIVLDGSSSITWDAMGCALLTPLTPYGRMAGSHSLGCLVRFSKLPEVSDIGFGQGVKRYGANFELTEV
jgi:hypothetical protein